MRMTTLPATIYVRPYGTKQSAVIENVYEEDALWLIENNVRISLEHNESLGTTVYGDLELTEEDNQTPREVVVFSNGRPCWETMTEFRKKCAEAMR